MEAIAKAATEEYIVINPTEWTTEYCPQDVANNIIAYLCDSYLGEEIYNDMLDDCYGYVEIAGIEYATSTAWGQIDPVAYDCGKLDCFDNYYYDIVDELEKLDNGESIELYDHTITKHELEA